jgi:hypothetical protein
LKVCWCGLLYRPAPSQRGAAGSVAKIFRRLAESFGFCADVGVCRETFIGNLSIKGDRSWRQVCNGGVVLSLGQSWPHVVQRRGDGCGMLSFPWSTVVVTRESRALQCPLTVLLLVGAISVTVALHFPCSSWLPRWWQ